MAGMYLETPTAGVYLEPTARIYLESIARILHANYLNISKPVTGMSQINYYNIPKPIVRTITGLARN